MRILIVSAVLLFLGPTARAQLAPGRLARPHQALEGAARCLSCHPVARRETMDQSCLACHREVGWLVSERRGLHAREGGRRCAACHPDHAGVDFSLIAWTSDSVRRFDHRRAGWTLEGAHAREECTACHTAEYRHGAAAALAPAGAAGQWTGLDPACVSCHADVHRGRLKAACTGCHETGQWEPAPGFDHGRTRYPLTGKHRPVGCAKCHRTSDGSLDPAFIPVPYQQCSTCHADPHAGSLGRQCSDCHVTAGFRERGARTFDHDRTRYPLVGAHGSVACGSCHGAANQRPRPPAAACGDCHADAHGGGAHLAGRPADCAACHDEGGFRASTYSITDHASSRYPLEGRHREVKCRQCHGQGSTAELGTARVRLRPAFASCASCHADPHRGAAGPALGECSTCHTPSGWGQSILEPARHAALGFPLAERHAEVACNACHVNDRSGPRFRLGRQQCADCHTDPHSGRYTDCASCHTARAFRPSTVDSAAHSAWRLPLEGAHRAVACVSCHPGMDRPATGPALIGRGKAPVPLALHREAVTCHACHDDPHGGQFLAPKSRYCEACHSLQSFRPADRFDHRRDTPFALDRGHERVPCASCHLQGRYRGTPARCEACHQ